MLALLSVLYKIVLLGTDLVSPTPNGPEPALVALPGYLDQFAVGMALAVVSAARPDLVARRAWPWAALAGGAFALSTVDGILGPPASFSDTGYLMRDLLYVVIALGLLVPAAFPGEGRGAVRRVLANPVLRWLGLLSYGIYLYHLAVLAQLSRWGLKDHEPVNDMLAWFALGTAGTILLATISWYALERPALRLRSLVPVRPGDARPRGAHAPLPARPRVASGPEPAPAAPSSSRAERGT